MEKFKKSNVFDETEYTLEEIRKLLNDNEKIIFDTIYSEIFENEKTIKEVIIGIVTNNNISFKIQDKQIIMIIPDGRRLPMPEDLSKILIKSGFGEKVYVNAIIKRRDRKIIDDIEQEMIDDAKKGKINKTGLLIIINRLKNQIENLDSRIKLKRDVLEIKSTDREEIERLKKELEQLIEEKMMLERIIKELEKIIKEYEDEKRKIEERLARKREKAEKLKEKGKEQLTEKEKERRDAIVLIIPAVALALGGIAIAIKDWLNNNKLENNINMPTPPGQYQTNPDYIDPIESFEQQTGLKMIIPEKGEVIDDIDDPNLVSEDYEEISIEEENILFINDIKSMVYNHFYENIISSIHPGEITRQLQDAFDGWNYDQGLLGRGELSYNQNMEENVNPGALFIDKYNKFIETYKESDPSKLEVMISDGRLLLEEYQAIINRTIEYVDMHNESTQEVIENDASREERYSTQKVLTLQQKQDLVSELQEIERLKGTLNVEKLDALAQGFYEGKYDIYIDENGVVKFSDIENNVDYITSIDMFLNTDIFIQSNNLERGR